MHRVAGIGVVEQHLVLLKHGLQPWLGLPQELDAVLLVLHQLVCGQQPDPADVFSLVDHAPHPHWAAVPADHRHARGAFEIAEQQGVVWRLPTASHDLRLVFFPHGRSHRHDVLHCRWASVPGHMRRLLA